MPFLYMSRRLVREEKSPRPGRRASSAREWTGRFWWTCPTLWSSTAAAAPRDRIGSISSLTVIGDAFDELLAPVTPASSISSWIIEAGNFGALRNLNSDSCPILLFLGEKCVSCSKKARLVVKTERLEKMIQCGLLFADFEAKLWGDSWRPVIGQIWTKNSDG